MPVNSEHQSRRALSALLRQPSTYGSIAFLGLCDLWSPEWLSFEPKTVQLEIRDDLGVTIEPDLFDKLMAARQVVTTDYHLRELPAFITLVNALNGDGVDTPVSQPIDPADLAWGVFEIIMLYPPSETETFSEEIIGYIEESLRWQGMRANPIVLDQFLSEAVYDDIAASDPDVMQAIFTRLDDVNAEIRSNINAWKYQLGQLRLANGNVDSLLEKFSDK